MIVRSRPSPDSPRPYEKSLAGRSGALAIDRRLDANRRRRRIALQLMALSWSPPACYAVGNITGAVIAEVIRAVPIKEPPNVNNAEEHVVS